MTKKLIENERFDFNKNPSNFHNSLIKLPGQKINIKEIQDFLDLYLNFGFINETTNKIESCKFRHNILIASESDYNKKSNKVFLDKSYQTYPELIKLLKKHISNLEDSLIIIHVAPFIKIIGELSSKKHMAPFGFYPGITKVSHHHQYSANFGMKLEEEITTDFNTVNNLLFTFTGNSSLDLSQILNPHAINRPGHSFNQDYVIAKYMFDSNLVKSTLSYGTIFSLEKLIDKYIKPKFLNEDFNYFLCNQENLNEVVISKGCKEIAEKVYITNPKFYEFMQNNPNIVQQVDNTLTNFKSLWETQIPTTAVVKPIDVTSTSSTNSKISNITTFRNKELDLDKIGEMKANNYFRINPVIMNVMIGIVSSDKLYSNNEQIPIGATVSFKQTQKNLELDIDNVYLCTITTKDKKVYSKVLRADEINKNILLIPKSQFSTFMYKYQIDFLKDILQLSDEEALNHLRSYQSLINAANVKYSKKTIIEHNYVVNQMRINGFKRYNVSFIHMLLAIAEYSYYSKSKQLNTLGGLLLTSYLEVVKDTFTSWIESQTNLDSSFSKNIIKIGDFSPLHEDVITTEDEQHHIYD